MRNLFRIFFIFLYFTFCFVFKGSFEEHLSLNTETAFKNINLDKVEQICNHNTSSVLKNNIQEIISLQNDFKNSNSINFNKKYNYSFLEYGFKNNVNFIISSNSKAYNLAYIIYPRAP